MPSNTDPIVFEITTCASFLQYILSQDKPPTTLVICSSREAFLQEITSDCQDNPDGVAALSSQSGERSAQHPLLIPTSHLLATSRTVNLVFAPTLMHLRAFLAAYVPPVISNEDMAIYEKPGSCTAMLAITSFLNLHRNTSDFSAQGLSRTMTLAVEASIVNRMHLIIADCSIIEGDERMNDAEEDGRALHRNPWKQQVPLLNQSVRFGGEERVWAGRTVELRQVLGRWCTFRTLDESTT